MPLTPAETEGSASLHVLVLEPDPAGGSLLAEHVEAIGHTAHQVRSAEEMLALLGRVPMDVVLVRLAEPGPASPQRVRAIRRLAPELEVVVVAHQNTVRAAIDAVRDGAHSFIVEPYRVNALEVALQKAGDLRRLRAEHAGLRALFHRRDRAWHLTGNAPRLREALDHARRVAPTDTPVLITGETGTGKRLLARYVHGASDRARAPFAMVQCAETDRDTLVTELFGAPRAPDAEEPADPGIVDVVAGGTLLLANIEHLPSDLQARLLRLVEEPSVTTTTPTTTGRTPNVRIIATSTADLRAAVAQGTFREDLFYYLNTIALHMPPLRERREDIPDLVRYFLAQAAARGPARDVEDAVLDVLTRYDWPGNVWELRNVVERAGMLARGPRLTLADLPHLPAAAGEEHPDHQLLTTLRLSEMEWQHIQRVLAHCDGNKSRAARVLGITPKTLYNKLNARRKGRDEAGSPDATG